MNWTTISSFGSFDISNADSTIFAWNRYDHTSVVFMNDYKLTLLNLWEAICPLSTLLECAYVVALSNIPKALFNVGNS